MRDQTVEPNWHQLFERVTQSLPPTAKLNDFQVESGGVVLLNGSVIDESVVFELVNEFRRLPGVSQVALRGTTPDESTHGVRFMIRLMTVHSTDRMELGTHHE